MIFKYYIMHNEKLKYLGFSHNDCFKYILDHQGQSVDYALKYGDWEINKIKYNK